MRAKRVERVVVLARGLGTRLKRSAETTALAGGQRAAAASGQKAMMPIGARPFLDYGLSRLAAAGFRKVCLVVGPEQQGMRDRYARLATPQLTIEFAEQASPRGTADAVRAAASIVGDDPFVVVNGDNLYPVGPLRVLGSLDGPGLVAFDGAALVRLGNIEPARLRAFAVLEIDDGDRLRAIVEKPSGPLANDPLVSMNCWRFDARIFAAIERLEPSARGELELPAAVRSAMRVDGVRFEAVIAREPVLDLTHAGDVAGLAERLAREDVIL